MFKDQAYLIHVSSCPKALISRCLGQVPARRARVLWWFLVDLGGRGDNGGCENCRSKTQIDIMVDVTRQLRHTLHLGRKDVTLKTLVIDANTDELIELDAESSKDTGIPLPELVGPWWRDASQLLKGIVVSVRKPSRRN